MTAISLKYSHSFIDWVMGFFRREDIELYTLNQIKDRYRAYYDHIWTKTYHPIWLDKQLIGLLLFLKDSKINPPNTDEKWIEWIERWFRKKSNGYAKWLSEYEAEKIERSKRDSLTDNKNIKRIMETHDQSWEKSNAEYRKLLKNNKAKSLFDLVELYRKGELKK